jgi:prepilin-type N-terminal cleavage/methylation domain-containing protein
MRPSTIQSRETAQNLPFGLPANRGFTMIELMVALGLAAGVAFFAFTIFLQFYKTTFNRQNKTHFYFTVETFTASLRDKLTHEPVIFLTENSFTTQNAAGKITHYLFDEERLMINGEPAPVSVQRFRVTALGPGIMLPEEAPWQRNTHVLAYLDEDLDGFIGMDELDKDGSGALEGNECMKIGLVGIELSFNSGRAKALNCMFRVHPRNRAAGSNDITKQDDWW